VDSIDAIEVRYPVNADKVRLSQDFKTHRYVQALKEHEEFRHYLNQKVLTERQWTDHSQIHAVLTPREESIKKKAIIGVKIRKEPTLCHKCGRKGHLQEFCDRIILFERRG